MKYTFSGFQFDTILFNLSYEGRLIPMEPQVYNLLAYLIENRDRVITKSDLLSELWDGKFVTESSLNTCVKAARKAVNDNGKNQHTIATVRSRGFRFVATVQEQEVTESSPSNGNEKSNKLTRPPVVDDRLTLVVIPFTHNPTDQEATWWADVFSEDISIHLARLPGFTVISRHSVIALEGDSNNAQLIGQTLQTQYVIEGSIRQINQEYRISVQLMEVESGQVIWVNHKRLLVQDIENHQSEVVQKIVAQLEPELNRAEFDILRHRKPENMGGWSLCREASFVLAQKGWSESTFSEVAELLRKAIKLDPDLAFAHALLSVIIALGHQLGLLTDSKWQAEASRAAEDALALDSQNSDVLGHAGCAFADLGNFQRGIPLMKLAIEINPGNAQAWAAVGAAKLRTGDESGIEDMLTGLKLSPRDSRLAAWGAILARALLSFGREEEAITAAKNACRYDDKIFLPRVILAIAHFLRGRNKEAIDSWKEAQRILPDLKLDDIVNLTQPDELKQLKDSGLFT